MSTLQTALEIAKNYPIFPCKPDKSPYTTHGYLDASQAPAQVTAWWKQYPNALIGVPTGDVSGFLVVDIDRKNGHNGLATIRNNGWTLPLTRIQETQSGGQHVFFQIAPEARFRCSAGNLGDGIDIRANGGYVIWWTVEGFQLLCDEPLATMPDWLKQALSRPEPRPATPPGGDDVENTAKVRSALASLEPDMSYQDWVHVGMALHHSTGGGTDGLALWDNWSAQGSKYRPGETAKKWESFGRPSNTPVTIATVYKMASAAGWRWKDAKPAVPASGPAPAPPLGTPTKSTASRDPTSGLYPRACDIQLTSVSPCTHVANSQRIAFYYQKRIHYVQGVGWIIWNGHFWQTDHTKDNAVAIGFVSGLSRRIAEEAAHLMIQASKEDDGPERKKLMSLAEERTKWAINSESISIVGSGLTLAKHQLLLTHDELNTDPYLFNVKNGTVNLRTGELQPHNPNDMITHISSVIYDANASCHTWDKFVSEIFGGEKNMVEFTQRAVGWSLTGIVEERAMFFLYGGKGKEGKSTFIETIMALMGICGDNSYGYARKVTSDTFMRSRNHDDNQRKASMLDGPRFICTSEVSAEQRLNEQLIKDITGGDTLEARRLYQEAFTFKPQFKPWMYGNHKPVIRGTDDAIWSRVRMVPFEVSFAGREDITLPAKLREELPGILNWAIKGALAWRACGLQPPQKVIAATQAYREEMDVISQFLEACCVIDENVKVKAADLYEAYQEWAGKSTIGRNAFFMAIAAKFEKRKGYAGFYYHGLGLHIPE